MHIKYIAFFLFCWSCVYRFEAERDERIRITIKKVVTANRQCLSRVDSDTKRSYCFGDARSKLLVSIARELCVRAVHHRTDSMSVFYVVDVYLSPTRINFIRIDYGTIDSESDTLSTWLRLQLIEHVRPSNRLHIVESSTWDSFHSC